MPPPRGLHTLMTHLRIESKLLVSQAAHVVCPALNPWNSQWGKSVAAQLVADTGQIEMDSTEVSCNALLAKSVCFTSRSEHTLRKKSG